MEAYGRPNGGEVAPKDGTIGQIQIIAGVPGTFRLQIAEAHPKKKEAKVLAEGPVIHYQGQGTNGQDNGPPYVIETFDVNVPVHKGDYLAVKAKKISFMRCSSGGPNMLFFEPPLEVGGSFEKADTTAAAGCFSKPSTSNVNGLRCRLP
jgi:hypothetical protein